MTLARATVAAALGLFFLVAAPSKAAAQSEEGEPADDPGRRVVELAQEALEADKNDRLDECVAKELEALAIEENIVLRLHLVSCLSRSQHLVAALKNARDVLAAALRDGGDERVKANAQQHIERILKRLPHVRFELHGKKLNVDFDGSHVPAALLSSRLAVDPGEHIVEAGDGECSFSRESVIVSEGEDRVVDVAPEPLPGLDAQCRKIEYPGPAITYVTLGLDMSAYTDTTNVSVLTPGVRATFYSPARGWKVGASYLVDVISSASPDVVSSASPGYHETRHAVAADGAYDSGSYGAELRSKVSVEPDCVSILGGGALTAKWSDAQVLPRLAYAHRDDRIGLANTPFSQFEHHLVVNDFEVGASLVLSSRSLLTTVATLETMRGDPSNPYRSVPLFGADVAPTIPSGASIELVNASRLPARPREQLPTERDRFALAARLNHRFDGATLRLEERAYTDTWGIKATTTDARYLRDFGWHLLVGPHLRFHGQSAASFYRLAYAGGSDSSGAATSVPLYRTTWRELSPMIAITAGLSTNVRLTDVQSDRVITLIFSGDVMHARYFESLYVTSRTAVYGTLGLEAEL